jgi:hypothetical protein
MKITAHVHAVSMSTMVELYLHSPIRLPRLKRRTILYFYFTFIVSLSHVPSSEYDLARSKYLFT